MDHSFLNFAAFGAIFGVLASFWHNFKAICHRVTGFAIQRVEINGTDVQTAIACYLNTHFTRSIAYDRSYGRDENIIRDCDPAKDKAGLVPYENFFDRSVLFWKGWKPLFYIGKESDRNNNSSPMYGEGSPSGHAPTRTDSTPKLTLSFIRGMFNIDKIITDSVDHMNQVKWRANEKYEKEYRRWSVFRLPNDANTLCGPGSSGLSFLDFCDHGLYRLLDARKKYGNRAFGIENRLGQLYFPSNVSDVISTVKHWRDSRDWYIRHGITWKMGMLFHGVPGTGKSALVRALGFDLDLPVFSYSLAQMDDRTLTLAWKKMCGYKPCIALFEDIDTVFKGRINIAPPPMPVQQEWDTYQSSSAGGAKSRSGSQLETNSEWSARGKVSFDIFINLLDGVDENDGVLTAITTNRIDHIDEALGRPIKDENGKSEWLSTRPGRIDRVVELGYMSVDDRRKFAIRILGDMPDALEEAMKKIETCTANETPAQAQEWMTRMALKYYWDKHDNDKISKAIASAKTTTVWQPRLFCGNSP